MLETDPVATAFTEFNPKSTTRIPNMLWMCNLPQSPANPDRAARDLFEEIARIIGQEPACVGRLGHLFGYIGFETSDQAFKAKRALMKFKFENHEVGVRPWKNTPPTYAVVWDHYSTQPNAFDPRVYVNDGDWTCLYCHYYQHVQEWQSTYFKVSYYSWLLIRVVESTVPSTIRCIFE